MTFPLSNLDPFRYTARNSNGASPTLAVTSLEQVRGIVVCVLGYGKRIDLVYDLKDVIRNIMI